MKKGTMKFTGLLGALLLIAGSAFGQATVKVTFRANTALFPDTLRPTHVVQIRGGLSGGSPSAAAGIGITWDAATVRMTNVGGDYWTYTFDMKAGDTLTYKFWGGYLNAAGAVTALRNGTEEGWESGPDRRYIVPAGQTADVVMPWTFIGNTQNTSPLVAKQDTFAVYFRVNVGNRVQQGLVVPGTTIVEVRGGTPPLTWGVDTRVKLTLEPVRNGDNYFYSGVAYFPSTVTTPIFYKFYAAGWESDAVGENGSNDRNFIPRRDTTLAWKFFNLERPSDRPTVNATVTFKVNTSYLQALNLYNETVGDIVTIRGGGVFGGWSADKDLENKLAYDDENFYYFLNKPITAPVGGTTTYKFYIKYDQSRADRLSPNFNPAIAANIGDFGYEEPVSEGGGNRVYEQTLATTRSLDAVFFNDIPIAGVIDPARGSVITGGGTTLPVTFRIDMTDAMDATKATVPMVADDSVFIVFESKLTALTQGFQDGDAPIRAGTNLARYQMKKQGETNVYAITWDLTFPVINDFGFRVAYGKPKTTERGIYTNGGGFDKGRRWYQFIQPVKVEAGPIEPGLGELKKVTWPAAYEFPILRWKRNELPIESSAGLYVSNENHGSGRVSGYELLANYPNPFNPTTTIEFRTPAAGRVTLEVFNVLGQKVATLMNNEMVAAGKHSRSFDAKNLSSGMYIYRMTANGFVSQRKMMLVK